MSEIGTKAANYFKELQSAICSDVEAVDGTSKFISDNWVRPDESGSYGGGGDTRLLRQGAVFEQAGVNYSCVEGTMPAKMAKVLTGKDVSESFFASGVSLVFHPLSPLIPTTHANVRYVRVGSQEWFGGGMDLTPYYLNKDDARHFHQTLKEICDRHDAAYYPKFKAECDKYFYLPHRQEARGVGGVFFDYCGRDGNIDLETFFEFVKDLGSNMMKSYLPIAARLKHQQWTKAQKDFQLVRRGRYVEFNLIYDRGTKFGLETNGRTESILMSLPPEVRWEYDYRVIENSPEAELLKVLKNPIEWASN